MAQATIKGRASGAGTGDPTDLSATQATAILNALVGDSGSGGTKGLVPAPAAGDNAANKYLRANGTWATVTGGTAAPGGATTQVQFNDGGVLAGDSGLTFVKATDVLTVVGGLGTTPLNATQLTSGTVPDGRFPATLPIISGANLTNLPLPADNSITNLKLADVATATFKGRTAAGTGDPQDLTVAQATALLNIVALNTKGLVPGPVSGDAAKFLRGDATWAAPPSGGTPGGANTQVQFNDGGVFGGSPYLTTDKNSAITTISYASIPGWLRSETIYEKARGIPLGYKEAWTPVWFSDMQLIGSTNAGEVTRVGSLVFFTALVIVGPGSYLVPAALITLTMPVPFAAATGTQLMGEGVIYSPTTGGSYKIGMRVYDGTQVYLCDWGTTARDYAAQVSNDTPFPNWFVSGTQIFLKGWYQESGY
jgi:hypothetical protein